MLHLRGLAKFKRFAAQRSICELHESFVIFRKPLLAVSAPPFGSKYLFVNIFSTRFRNVNRFS